MTSLHPTSTSERIDALDAMRGMAILGVLLAYTVWSLGNPPQETWNGTDRAVERGMGIFVDGKFLSMFAFLFGMGVAQQWRRWVAAGFDPLPLHLRRMGFLLGIGLLHAVLLRNGDILAPYAILGLTLLLFRTSIKIVAITVPLLFIIPYVAQWFVFHGSWPARPGAVAGGYLAENLAWLRYWYETNPLLGWPHIFLLVLLGFMAGRAQLVERFARSRGLAGWALIVSLLLAIGTRLAYDILLKRWSTPSPRSFLHSSVINAIYEVNSWVLAATYIAALLLVLQLRSWVGYLWPLRAVGRMAFTNYLSQGLIIVPLCLAFGWFDKVSPSRGLLLAVAFALLQILFSTWWLRHHAAGPFERLWRRVTYLS